MIFRAKEVKAATALKMEPTRTNYAKTNKTCTFQANNLNGYSYVYRSFIQHDLSGVPQNVIIKRAVFCGYDLFHDGNADSGTVNIAKVTSAWEENTLSWNYQPSFEGTYLKEDMPPPGVNKWTSWDITDLVQGWIDGTYPNYGLHVKNNNEDGYKTTWDIFNRYYSEEYASYIEIEYEPRKYLIRSGSTLYTVTDGALSALHETQVTAEVFQIYGLDEAPDGSLLVGLTDPEVLCWQDSADELPNLTLTVKGTPPLPQMFTSEPMDLTHESIAGISHAAVDASEDVRFAISFDGGTTWEAHDGSAWFDTSDTVPGMLPSTMNAITAEQWAEVVVLDSYMVRFWLPNVTAYVRSVVMHYINP